MCFANGVTAKSLFATSLEVTGKTFIGGPCVISNGGSVQFNTSQSPGAAVLITAEAPHVTFDGSGEMTLYGNPGIEILGNETTSLIFRALPHFSNLAEPDAGIAILGNSSTVVHFENVQGIISGNIAAGLIASDGGSNVTILGQNILSASVEGNVQFSECDDTTIGDATKPENNEMRDGEIAADDVKMSPAHLHAMRNILLHAAVGRKDALSVGTFKTNRSDCNGIHMAWCYALKNTPSSIAVITGRVGPKHIEQNYYGICLANASDACNWNMYGFWHGKRHRIFLYENERNSIACVGCAQGYSPWRMHYGKYIVKSVLCIGAEHQIVRQSFLDDRTGEANSERFSQTVANFSLSLNAINHSGKINLTAKTGLWKPIHADIQNPREYLALGKLYFCDVRCTKYLLRNFKCELMVTESLLNGVKEFCWGSTLMCEF
ncbi:MAG: hypothetical protein LBI34_02970 [Puniceicoccales bacterium]|jgi:hypothetical protein|nr:hypothetical protein [Puniceicoccales bacterium]